MASLTRDLTFFDVVSPFTFLTSWQQQASRPELTTFLKSFQHSMTQPSSQQEEEVGTVIVARGHVGWGQGKSLSPSIRSQLWEKGRFKISPIFHHLSSLFSVISSSSASTFLLFRWRLNSSLLVPLKGCGALLSLRRPVSRF